MKKDIYIIKNDINDKVYIGQAKNAKTRFQSHCKPSAAYIDNELIAKAIQKYGKEHFWYEILDSQVEDYNDKECFYIEKFNSIAPNGYNILTGGENPPTLCGFLHPESALTEDDVEALTDDLMNTNISFPKLAKKYGFSANTSISEFNSGKTYTRDCIDYPIRKNPLIGKLEPSDVDEIVNILQTSYMSFEKIGEMYGVKALAISRINRGLLHKMDIEYPIRNGQVGTNQKMTYDQVTNVINDLIYTNKSLRAISRDNGCDYAETIGIKNGTIKLYRRKGLAYPLRSNN